MRSRLGLVLTIVACGPERADQAELSTLQSEVVATRVWSYVELASDRWLVVDGWDLEDERGELQVIDGETGEARVVDRDVSACIECLEPHELPYHLPWRTDEVVYQVRDPGTGRTGLWRARFPE